MGRIASGAASSPSMTAMVFFITWRGVAHNGVVPGERLELSQGCPYQILSLARLPISPPRRELAPAIAGHEDCSEPGHAGQSLSRLQPLRGCAVGAGAHSSSSARKRSVSGSAVPTFSIVTGLSCQAAKRSRMRAFGPTKEISSPSSSGTAAMA